MPFFLSISTVRPVVVVAFVVQSSQQLLLRSEVAPRVRVQIKVRLFSKKYCSPCVSTQLHLNVWLDSPRSEKKSVPFRIEKLNFLRKLWSLAFLAKKLVLISFFFYLLKLRILTVKKSKFFNGQKSSKKFFFEDLTHIYISIQTITNSFEKFYG